ncbi:MAG: aminoglycoside phosphotransferase family protein [Chromatiales bacterium]|nr:aminoglycoside phosphotransferase family protein [Chromatiales bacterium]
MSAGHLPRGMTPGRLLGVGKTSEVRELGRDAVIKLFVSTVPPRVVEREHCAATLAFAQGVATPEVLDLVRVGEGLGLVMRRVRGRPLDSALIREPWRIRELLDAFVRLQRAIHSCDASPLECARHRIALEARCCGGLPQHRRIALADQIQQLEPSSRLCHLDFHFHNVLSARDGLWVIDWGRALAGPPSLDVAVTALKLRRPISRRARDRLHPKEPRPQRFLERAYLRKYRRQTTIDVAKVQALEEAVEAALHRRWALHKDEAIRIASDIVETSGIASADRFLRNAIADGLGDEQALLGVGQRVFRRVDPALSKDYASAREMLLTSPGSPASGSNLTSSAGG